MNQDQLNKLLFVSISQHNIHDTVEIIQEGADVNASLYWHYDNSKYGNFYGEICAIELAIYRYLTIKKEKVKLCLTIIELLIKHGAILNRCCVNGENDFINERTSILKDLAWGFDGEDISNIHVQKHYFQLFSLLLENGADPLHLVDYGSLTSFDITPLEIIAYKLKEREECYFTVHFLNEIIFKFLLNGCPVVREDRIKKDLNNTKWGETFKFWLKYKDHIILFYCFLKKNLQTLHFYI